MKVHLLDRTSPMGDDFIARCRYCGKEGLTTANLYDECESGKSSEEAILDALEEGGNHGK